MPSGPATSCPSCRSLVVNWEETVAKAGAAEAAAALKTGRGDDPGELVPPPPLPLGEDEFVVLSSPRPRSVQAEDPPLRLAVPALAGRKGPF